jgi:hypothetical protein
MIILSVQTGAFLCSRIHRCDRAARLEDGREIVQSWARNLMQLPQNFGELLVKLKKGYAICLCFSPSPIVNTFKQAGKGKDNWTRLLGIEHGIPQNFGKKEAW